MYQFGTRRELFDWIHKIYMMRDRPRWPYASGEKDLRTFLQAMLYPDTKACMFLEATFSFQAGPEIFSSNDTRALGALRQQSIPWHLEGNY
jgi:hypothetical protein